MDEQKELLDLYEQYMDEQTLEMINEEDEKEEPCYKIIKKRVVCRYPKEMQITIKEFVYDYLGLTYINCDNLWHQGLKNIGSNLIFGVDNEFSNKYPDRVYKGELLLVRDARGNIGTYINPRILNSLLESDDIERQLKILRRNGVSQLSQLNDYMQECMRLASIMETNNSYMELLEETHKTKKYKQVKREIKHD